MNDTGIDPELLARAREIKEQYERSGLPVPPPWSEGYYDRQGRPLDYYVFVAMQEAANSPERWAAIHRVANTVVDVDDEEVEVSTVWLGRNHNFGPVGPPIIFETMVFGDVPGWDSQGIRYSTEEQAMRGHLDVVERLQAGRPPFDE